MILSTVVRYMMSPVKVHDCPLHGGQCKAQPGIVSYHAHAGIPDANLKWKHA